MTRVGLQRERKGAGRVGDRCYVKRSSPISKASSQWNITTEKHFIKRPVFIKKDSIIILYSKV